MMLKTTLSSLAWTMMRWFICRLELEAQREKRERDAWEREMRDMRELEFMEKLKQEMELKLPTGLCTV